MATGSKSKYEQLSLLRESVKVETSVVCFFPLHLSLVNVFIAVQQSDSSHSSPNRLQRLCQSTLP